MTEHPPLRLAQLLGPCPECGNGRMEAVLDDDGTTNFLCRGCGCCWHAELEWSRLVDPLTCPGCSARRVCEAARRPFGAVLPPRN